MDILSTITEHPHAFLQPHSALHASALQLAKQYLDPLASQITETQVQRQQAARKSRKRKRSSRKDEDDDVEESLRVKQIYTDGFDVNQIWHQAHRVLNAAGSELERSLPDILPSGDELSDDADGRDPSDDDELGEEGEDWESNGEDVSDRAEELAEEEFEEDDDFSGDEGSVDLEDDTPPSDFDEDEDEEETGTGEEFVKDPNGLNDGFFSIDQFNKQTQFLEQQDARGDPDDGAASDEEDVDWTADPLGEGFAQPTVSKRTQGKDLDTFEDDDEEEEDAGPTFGNANLNGPDSDEDMDDEAGDQDLESMGIGGDFSNTNSILYSDFFAPPAKNVPKSKKQGKRSGRFQQRDSTQQVVREDDDETNEREEADEEVERAMSGVQRDLFDDEPSDEEDDPVDEGELLPGQRNLSTHERAQLALRAEIRRLEAENVAAKPWAQSGETVAPARPQNALLEEDLDFERAGKPVPVITAEINESIEDLIKRRILAKEFDEVCRRRPDELLNGEGKESRRGQLAELSDAKPKKGLADEYEEDYLKQNDPNHVDTRSEALKAQHKQIEQQWAQVSAQLDALSNWHYKPRPVAQSLDVRVDAPTITMEDARPSAGGDAGEAASALAPQELYSIGADGKRTGEVISKGGTVAGKEEETQDQRTRRRRRQKERRKKAEGSKPIPVAAAGDKDGVKGTGEKRAKKSEVVSQLKKGGVKVIGKKGELQDVEGNAVKKDKGRSGAGSFKL